MSEATKNRNCETFSRVRLVAQPLSLGIILVAIGGYFGWHMIAAYTFSEPWWLQLANVALIVGFGSLFLWGLSNLLSLFQQVRIYDGEVELSMFGLVLQRIPEETIQSVRSLSKETTLRNKEVEYFRIYIHHSGKRSKKLWLDWTIAKEEALREHLPNTLFLM